MKLMHVYQASPYRTYCVPKRCTKRISTFLPKNSGDYLDYSVDFLRVMQDGEKPVCGHVSVQGQGLKVENTCIQGTVLTAFVSEGLANRSFYLEFKVRTNMDNSLIQGMILPTFGKKDHEMRPRYGFVAFRPDMKPPEHRPPLNSIKLCGRHLLWDDGFFMGV